VLWRNYLRSIQSRRLLKRCRSHTPWHTPHLHHDLFVITPPLFVPSPSRISAIQQALCWKKVAALQALLSTVRWSDLVGTRDEKEAWKN
jgi:hypothetical protein